MCSLRLVPKENHLILESYTDFILSRKAVLLSDKTVEFYKYTTGGFVNFLIMESVFEPEAINSSHIRGYLTEVNSRKVTSATVHAHARGTRAFLRFLNEEGYILTPIKIKMPRVEQKKMRVLSPDELDQILKVCTIQLSGGHGCYGRPYRFTYTEEVAGSSPVPPTLCGAVLLVRPRTV